MTRIHTFGRFFLAALAVSVYASGADAFPQPREDVRKLEKPTISYNDMTNYEVRLIDWDGQNDRLWLKDRRERIRFASGIEWAPNGERAAVSIYDLDAGYAPYVIDLSTGRAANVEERFENDLSLHGPSWSPDSRSLALWGYKIPEAPGSSTGDIYTLHLTSGRLTRVTNSPQSRNWGPSWSPVESKFVFSAINDDLTGRDIYTINLDGSGRTRLTFPATDNSNNYAQAPSWSPDGKRIAFTAHIDTEFPELNVFLIDADGSNLEKMTTSPNWDHAPRWSPDGKWLVYFSGPWVSGELWNVFRVHVETKEVVQLTFNGGRDPTWVLAGRSRFLSVDPSGKKPGRWAPLKQEGTAEQD